MSDLVQFLATRDGMEGFTEAVSSYGAWCLWYKTSPMWFRGVVVFIMGVPMLYLWSREERDRR